MHLSLFYLGILGNHQLRLNKDSGNEGWGDSLIVEAIKPAIKPPRRYKVIMLNDDYTPMEFVVDILERFFAMDKEAATQVMLQVHTEGKAVCGVFTRDIAQTKAMQVNQCARKNEHPLLCEIDAVEDE